MVARILLIFLLSPICVLAANAGYSINLQEWPSEIANQFRKEVPDLTNKSLSEEQVNKILKNLDHKFRFNNLQVLKNDASNELMLVGEISAEIEKINFQGLDDISESEALLVMNLSLKTAIEEDHVKLATEKLIQFYQEHGYRFAQVNFHYTAITAFKKSLMIEVITKGQSKISEVGLENIDGKSREFILRDLNWKFKNSVLNQDTLSKISLRLRKLLSQQGYYLTQIPPPKLIFSADELRAKAQFKLEKRSKYSVEITNVMQFATEHLEEDILKLDTYFSADSNIGADLSEKLKLFYKSEGYPHVNIPYFERKEDDRIVVTLNVEEGPYTSIKTINFVGQLSKDNKFYEKKFLDVASPKVQSRIYVKDDIETAAKNLLVSLQNEGYVNARLGLIQITTDREKPQEGLVTIQLYEGDQVELGAIIFEGNAHVPEEVLKKELDLSVGKKLSLKDLESSLVKLKTYYTSLGYIEYKLLNENTDLIQYTLKNSVAQLKYKIEEGPRVEVQSILIEGNDRTHEKVILTEIDFKPGDTLTPAKLDESIARLQRTGHFSSIDISTLEAGTSISQRTVIIKVSERDPGIFTIGGGVTNENNGTIHGFTGLAYRNIGGWGRGLSLRGDGNYNYAGVKFVESKITFGFVEPYLFETRVRFRTNLTRSKTISDYSLRKVTELNLTTFSLEQDFTSHFTGIWEVLSVATYLDRGITVEDEIAKNYTRADSVIASTGVTLDLDYRNNLFNPTQGHFSRVSVEYASDKLGSSNVDDFVRATGQTTFYFSIQKTDYVFAQSVRGGFITDVHSLDFGIPYDKRGFTLGGRTTIRGFGSNEFFPSADLSNSFKLTSFASYQLVKSELRFPLVRKWDLMGAVFYDGGQVLINGIDIGDRWRDAVGVGVRYNTPVGPLNLEYATKLAKKATEHDGAFHLSIGVF